MKIKLSDEKIIGPWKTRIISLMQTKFTEGITYADVLKVYPAAPQKFIELAIKELAKDKVADVVPE